MGDSILCGTMGKYLFVDLSQNLIQKRKLPAQIFIDYVGGRGLATRLFCDIINPKVDPLAPENVIVIATSPLTGTSAPTAGRGHMVFKSPLTGAIGTSNSGGEWAVYFKRAGYDALVITGRAPHPVYLYINEEKAEIYDASHLWSKDVHQTTDMLFREYKPGTHRVLAIGIGGEKLVRFAAIINEKNRAYGRCGPGAVMGSKNLKAIVVSGNKSVPIKDEKKYRSGFQQGHHRLKAAPATKRILRELGTAGLVKLIDAIDMLPHNNFQDTIHRQEDLDKICGETIHKTILEKVGGCYRCPIACQRHTKVGDKTGEGPEYETVVLMGPVCGIYDLATITRANYLCNELGLDTISFGGTVAAAMELYERGVITSQDTGGLELRFGNASVLEELVILTAHRKGFGDQLAEGSLRLTGRYGHPEISMSIKGMELPAYDPRASYTQALGYMTSPTGACHLRGGYAVSLAFFGGSKEIPRFSIRQSPVAVRNVQDLGIVQDSLGVCRFTGYAFTIETWSRMLSGVTGEDFSTHYLEKLAQRIAALERLFNLEAGFTDKDDTLPERFQKEPIHTEGMDVVVKKEHIEKLRRDYYKVRNWDEHGIPNRELLQKLNIDDNFDDGSYD